MMIHDFDLCRFYLGKDKINEIHALTSSFQPFYKKINDHELAVVTMKSKKGSNLCNNKFSTLFFWIRSKS